MSDKVSAGQKLKRVPHRLWNSFVDAGRGYRDNSLSTGGPALEVPDPSPVLIGIVGSGTSVWPRCSIITPTEPYIDPNDTEEKRIRLANEIIMRGRVPEAGDEHNFVVLNESIAPSSVGEAIVQGLALVQLDVGEGEGEFPFAEAATSSDYLVPSLTGPAKILWPTAPRDEGTGSSGVLQWVVVLMGANAPHEYKAVTTEEIEYDNSGMVSIWLNGADTEVEVEAHLNWMHGEQNVSSDKEVLIRWFPDEQKWVIVGAEC